MNKPGQGRNSSINPLILTPAVMGTVVMRFSPHQAGKAWEEVHLSP